MGVALWLDRSPRFPASRLTTPPGESLVAKISANVSAGSGYWSDATITAVLPLKITWAVRVASGTSAGASGARTATTPVGSGVVKLKCDVATGFTLPKTCEYLSVQPAK